MTDSKRIAEILKAYTKKNNISASSVILEEYAEELLANGVIVSQRKIGRLVYEINYDEKEKTYFIKSSKGRLEITLSNRL